MNYRVMRSPLLLLVFNRLDKTRQVFHEIRRARPEKIYIAADGPRINVPGEMKEVDLVREYLLSRIDWPCEVKTLFRDENLGCRKAVSGAITWFFDNEECGVILEDDCVPTQSFFVFCDEMLEKYKFDERIGQICGFNPIQYCPNSSASYLFSKFGPIWGWASWRRVWNDYDVSMASWESFKKCGYVKCITESLREEVWRIQIFDRIYKMEVDTWDYQWAYAKLTGNRLNIIPVKNLVKNIGFGSDATHTKGKLSPKLLEVFDLEDIVHPEFVMRDKVFDDQYLIKFAGLNNVFMVKSILKTALSFLFRRGIKNMLNMNSQSE